MTSKRDNRSKSSQKKKSNSVQKIYSDDEIDELMKDITVKKPRNPFTHFFMEQINDWKKKNPKETFTLKGNGAFIKKAKEKWSGMSDNSKKPYIKEYENDKVKYAHDLQMVSHYLFKDFNQNVMRKPTAYRIFLMEQMEKGFDDGKEPKEIKAKAMLDWKNMTLEEKKQYLDAKKENDNWFEKAAKVKKVTPVSMFVQKMITDAKNNHKEPPSLKELAPKWKKMSEKEKQRYEQFADETNEERKKLQDLYDITHGVKPRRPAGAYKIFLQEQAKLGNLTSINDGREKWLKLSEEEKEAYLAKSKKTLLAYKFKSLIYKKKLRKIMPKRPGNAFTFFLKEKKGQEPAEGENFMVFWKKVYDELPNDRKKKYEEKAENAKVIYQKKMDVFKNKVFDMPTKPITPFASYVKEKLPELKDKKKGTAVKDLVKIIAKEWKKNEKEQEPYYAQFEKEKKVYKRQLKEFEKNGYYTLKETKEKEEESENEEEEEDSKKKNRKTRSKSKGKKSKSTKKTGKTSKSSEKAKKRDRSSKKSKTQRVPSKKTKK